MKFDAFKTDKYWNKFRKNEIGVVNAMNNYFQNQRSKLTDNFLPSSPRYQFTSFL